MTGSFFWGYLVTQLIGGRFAEIFGTKYIFGSCQAAAVLITCCLPVLADAGVEFFIVGRVLLGMTQVTQIFLHEHVFCNFIILNFAGCVHPITATIVGQMGAQD